MSWYTTGTVAVTNGSATITGVGTGFVANVQPGFAFLGPDYSVYEVLSVNSDTSLTLTGTGYRGTTLSAQAYGIFQTQGIIATLSTQVATLLATFGPLRVVVPTILTWTTAATNTFVAGTDFTPGTTSVLTLSRAYTSTAQFSLFFDGTFQGPENIASIVGATCTLTAPIPVGVGKVYERGAIPLGVGTPGDASVTVPKLASDTVSLINTPIADYTALRAYSSTCKSVYVTGYLVSTDPSGIAGTFVVDDNDVTSTDDGGTVIVNPTTGKRWKRVFTGNVNLAWFNVDDSGATSVSTALNSALALGRIVEIGPGDFLITLNHTINAGGIVGAGADTSGVQRTRLICSGLTDVTKGAIQTRQATWKGGKIKLERFFLMAQSWDSVTGALGNGLDIEAPVLATDIYVYGFKLLGILLHQDSTLNGPYGSVFKACRSHFNGRHGTVVGNGANAVTFINHEGKWNGATVYGVAPVAAGSYDGFYVGTGADSYPSYSPEGVTVIGGDCSYNSRYGWYFTAMRTSSSVTPAYAEFNWASGVNSGAQAFIGPDVQHCKIDIGTLSGGSANLTINPFNTYGPTNMITCGGQKIPYVTGLVQDNENLTQSVSANGSNSTRVVPNSGTGGTALQLFGTAAMRIGAGSFQLDVAPNVVGIPAFYLRMRTAPNTIANVTNSSGLININYTGHGLATNDHTYITGVSGTTEANGKWDVTVVDANNFTLNGSAFVNAYVASTGTWTRYNFVNYNSGPPGSGAHSVGDRVDNSAPTAGSYLAWECCTNGNPSGNWRGAGLIT